jgi:uncharacterized protein (TIGR02231 family)
MVPAGDHRLIVRGLPDPIDASNLRIYAGSAAVRLGGVEVQKIVDTDFVSEGERTLRRKLVNLQDQRVALQDDIPTAESQLKLIDSLASLPGDRNDKAVVDRTSIQGMLALISTGSEAARAKIRAANIAIRSLDDEIVQVKAELAKIATARKTTTEVRATIEASVEVTVPVSLEYRVVDAGWSWLYEARLDTQTKRMSLFRQASIRQGSGEDWANAEVSVTTARPRQNAGTPPVKSAFLSLRDHVVPVSDALSQVTVTGTRTLTLVDGRRAVSISAAEMEAQRITTDEFATEFVQDFRIPSRVSILADRQVRVYAVAEEAFDTELVARAVMTVDPTARLEAVFRYARETPIDVVACSCSAMAPMSAQPTCPIRQVCSTALKDKTSALSDRCGRESLRRWSARL